MPIPISARSSSLLEQVHKEAQSVPDHDLYSVNNPTPSEDFGVYVFNLKAMAKALPKPIFTTFIKQLKGRSTLDKVTADAIAHAVRVWAQERGATHFTHWFQPQTDSTAEKHDSFLTLKSSFAAGYEDVTPLDAFSGSQLLQSEPDASSFPNGGIRSTFEARGYTIWDTTSPMFLLPAPNNTSILYIPSVYISYNGDALDQKTVLLRSNEAVNRAAVDLLSILEPSLPGTPPVTSRVFATLGTEQEFFLIDRSLFTLRPDLKITGRALLGCLPPKHQQMEDHYFGKLPSRVLETISEAETALYKLGVPVKTRHNEVAPSQFEIAPIFEEAGIAVDHNLLSMDIIHKVAHKKGLSVLYHEKPFAGINGSGKHCNWSLSTDRGANLLDPTVRPETNYRFLIFVLAVLNAVHKYGGLLRASIASASNDHRLGAQEAPPGIISVFLGDHISEVLNAIEENRPLKTFSQPSLQTIKLGGTILDLKVPTLPHIDRDLTDRNRTSPFAFTGNKFEFRAVGSKQTPSFPVAILNAAVASSLREITQSLLKQKGDKQYINDEDKLTVIREFITKTKPVRFEGDNYTDDWAKLAADRGLLNIKTSLEAFKQLLDPVNKAMLTDPQNGIFSETELTSRYHILVEKYAKDVLVEADTLVTLVNQHVVPAVVEHRKTIAEGLAALKSVGAFKTLLSDTEKLSKAIEHVHHAGEPEQEAAIAAKEIIPLLTSIRTAADELENVVADKHWPLPKFHEILFQ
ncbi:glutamine synthetase/guanido kinase [Conidiobolus coronatus NRRL 28638]|uniref:Glutamine synthetase/guanido kinase n=1 Tax=Conidiobolus coronatus (strain ATCC 28846 / CBS 209.66 / NRRL 28638) TaxID=796925 RepID=A0A137P1S0_CONC2|nr:glutamine synthetase/guanido kinase [Conidiobolus coronatus NRRL 28638]|eukprot:KXN69010.1 glutamine synthetase/guanido kinase [Conidiobolus coronatus NRRL 28638]